MSISTWIIAGIVLLAFLALRSLPKRDGKPSAFVAPSEIPQQRNMDALPLPVSTISAKPLLSPWEKAVIDSVRAQLPLRHHLCPQVRLLDMLSVEDEDRSRQQTTRNRLGSKSVDFAIINPEGRVVLVIELHDRSHDQPERRDRDRLVQSALDQAGIPLAIFRPRQPIDLGRWLKVA